MKHLFRGLALFLAALTLLSSFVIATPSARAASSAKLYQISKKTYEERIDNFVKDSRWKNGLAWHENKSTGKGGKRPELSTYECWTCMAYAADFAAFVYGINEGRWNNPFQHKYFTKYKSAKDIKAGDVINTPGHWFVVLKRDGNRLYTAEGNRDDKVCIGWDLYKIIDNQLYVVYGKSKEKRSIENGYHYSFAPEFKLKFDANGGQGTMADYTVAYADNRETPAVAFTRPGYAFSHWTVSRSSDNKYYCKQENGTKEGWYLESEIPAGYVKKPYPDKYSFCWSTKNSSEVITVHAEWKRIGNYFTVSYHPNGGKGTMEDTTVIYGVNTQLPLATFTKDGYGVAGWNVYRKSDGKWLYRRNNKAEGGKWCVKGKEPKGYTLAVYKNGTTLAKTSKVNGDEIQLYAVWKKAFTVEYDANGGTGAMEDTLVIYGQNTKIPQCTFVRNGYKFKGWNVYRESDGKWLYRYNNNVNNGKWCKEGTQPKGYTLAAYKNGTTVAKTSAVAGDTIRFIAVWDKIETESKEEQKPTTPKEEEQKPTVPKEEAWKPTVPKDENDGQNSGTTNTTPPVEEKEEPVQKVCTLAVKNLYLPPAKLANGSAFTISGVVTSEDTITSVTISVKDAGTGKVVFSGTAQPNSKSYSLFNLDGKMTFSKLAAGNYVLEVTAKDAVGEKTLVKHAFAKAPSNIQSSGMVYPSGTLTKGKTFRVSGKVTSNDKLSKVELCVYTTDGKKMFSASANPNATSYDVYGLDSKMTFRQLPAGKYIYRVIVTDTKSVTKYVVSMSFTVK